MTIQTDDIESVPGCRPGGQLRPGRHSPCWSRSPPSAIAWLGWSRNSGPSLFHRSTRGATLTPAGDAFLPYAERTLDLLDDAAATLQDTRRGASAAGGRAHDVRPPRRAARPALARHASTAASRCGTHTRTRSSPRSIDGGCDAGFVVPGARPRQLRFVTLPPDPVVAVVAPSHPLAGRRATMHDLDGSPRCVQPFRHRRRRVRRAPPTGRRARMELDRVLRRRHRPPSGRPGRPRGHGHEVPGRRPCRARHGVPPRPPAAPALDDPAHLRLPARRPGRSRHCRHPVRGGTTAAAAAGLMLRPARARRSPTSANRSIGWTTATRTCPAPPSP